MNTIESIKLANKAYDALAPLNNISWTSHREKLFTLCKEEEKDHRGFLPEFQRHHTNDTASVADAARLFAVKRVAEYLCGEEMPKGKDFLHTQTSCFYAAGLVDAFREKIQLLWNEAGIDARAVRQLDYTQIVKVRRAA